MIWLLIDYISERLEKRKYRAKKKAYRNKAPDKMERLFAEIEAKYRLLKRFEDGEEIVRYLRLLADDIGKDAIDRFVLSYRQWCRNHGHQYEELSLNRDIYEHIRGGRHRTRRYSLTDGEPSGTVAAFADGDDEKTLIERYCGTDNGVSDAPGASALDCLWDPDAVGDDLLYEEMMLLDE